MKPRSVLLIHAVAVGLLLAACSGSEQANIQETQPPATEVAATGQTSPPDSAAQPEAERDSSPEIEVEEERERQMMASRDLAVELAVPDGVEVGVPFDVEVELTVQSFAGSDVDFSFVLPDGLEIVGGGVCPAGGGNVECDNVVDSFNLDALVLVTMVWNPAGGVESADFEVSVTDRGIQEQGMDAADGNPDNNTAVATLALAQGS